mmetsp:Transcript_12683/g.58591  ORF Transcript_12683/g.58591 Transcript_12683/m.58591 type:complete len:263 (+) Transcript_12683:470-1258(+)
MRLPGAAQVRGRVRHAARHHRQLLRRQGRREDRAARSPGQILRGRLRRRHRLRRHRLHRPRSPLSEARRCPRHRAQREARGRASRGDLVLQPRGAGHLRGAQARHARVLRGAREGVEGTEGPPRASAHGQDGRGAPVGRREDPAVHHRAHPAMARHRRHVRPAVWNFVHVETLLRARRHQDHRRGRGRHGLWPWVRRVRRRLEVLLRLHAGPDGQARGSRVDHPRAIHRRRSQSRRRIREAQVRRAGPDQTLTQVRGTLRGR